MTLIRQMSTQLHTSIDDFKTRPVAANNLCLVRVLCSYALPAYHRYARFPTLRDQGSKRAQCDMHSTCSYMLHPDLQRTDFDAAPFPNLGRGADGLAFEAVSNFPFLSSLATSRCIGRATRRPSLVRGPHPRQSASCADETVIIQQSNILQRRCCYSSLFPRARLSCFFNRECPLPCVKVGGYRPPAMGLGIG